MNVLWIDFVVVDNRAQTRTGERNLRVRIFALNKISVNSCRKCVLSEIVKTEKRRKRNSSHSAANCAFLRVQTVGENALVSCEVKRFVLVGVVGFLKNRDVIGAVLVKILVLVRVHRVNLNSHVLEILVCNRASLADILDVGHFAAFAR